MAGRSRRIIEGHHDFGVLEARLAAWIRTARETGGDPLGPVAVVAPTGRLLTHLQAVLAERFPALLNVRFFHHHALASAAARAAGAVLPRLLPERVQEAILARVIGEAGGDLARYVETRPGAVRALLATLGDLREAEVPLAAAEAPGLSPHGRATLRLYARFGAALDALAADLADRSGVLAAARPHVASFASRFCLVVHYGAYELTGAARSLMLEVERGAARTVYLTPHHPTAPAYVYSRRFWATAMGDDPVPVPAPASSDRLAGDALALLYREDARPVAVTAVDLFHAQGAAGELREVALRILRLHEDTALPLRRIAVIARSLEPYAAFLEPVFLTHGLPFTTSATLPARRDPTVGAALRLLRLAARDYERQPLLDLARSGLLRIDGRPIDGEAPAWDGLSRQFRVIGGFAVWTRDLPAWVADWRPFARADDPEGTRRAAALKEARRRHAGVLAGTVRSIDRTLRPLRRAGGWREWADRFDSALAALLDGFERREDRPAGALLVRGVLAEMRDLQTAGVPFSSERAMQVFASAVAESPQPLGAVGGAITGTGDDNGGVRVLDAMQARGLGFEAVYLIGFNADLFPRRPREDPFLGDADRDILAGRFAVLLPRAAGAGDEEHLLLAHLLGGARRHLTVSWQRADDAGRARVPSLALREVARLARRDPGLQEFLEAGRRVPAHPGDAARQSCHDPGLLSPAEARLGAALACHDPDRLEEALGAAGGAEERDADDLTPGIDFLKAIEDGEAADLRFDACPGAEGAAPATPGAARVVWSPSRLETFGRCPQRYFFAHVLGAEELDDPARAHDIDPADMGARVHEALRRVYAGLRDVGHLAGADTDAEAVAARARLLLDEAWRASTSDLEARLRPRLPALWEALSASWLEAIGRFLEADLGALVGAGARVVALEQEIRSGLDLGEGRTITLRGRVDRAVRTPERLRVGDYKTGRNLKAVANPSQALKGHHLQMALYILLAERAAADWNAGGVPVEAEVLGVGPHFTASGGGVRRDEVAHAILGSTAFGKHRPGTLETLGVLDALAADALFPLDADDAWCRHCPFDRACRRRHVPTLDRLGAVDRLGDFYRLSSKSTRAPLLETVRGGEEAEDDA